MTDVFLIHPPVSFTAEHLENDIIPDCPPLGLLYLASSVEKEGFTVKVLDAVDGSITIREILTSVEREKPKVIGITAMTMNIRGAVQLAQKIKEEIKDDCQVCLGGPHMSADPDIIRRFPYFDFGIVGEADITFPKMVNEIIHHNGKPKGIIAAEVPLNLDEIPFPNRHLVDWEYYKKERGFWANAVMATRGCPFKCLFCSIPAILRRYRVRSPELVVREMIEAYSINGNKTFVFPDDIFTLRKDYVFALCREIKNSKIPFKWEAQTRANMVDDELLTEMRAAGCYKLLFGVESGNERIRIQVVNKKITDEEIQRTTELCWENKIEPDWYLMLGFPTETEKELYDTVDFPIKLKPHPNMIGVHITTPLPGAPLFDQVIAEGIIPSDIVDRFIKGELGEGYKDVWPYYVPEGLTLEQLKAARGQAYKRFYFRAGYIMKRLRRDFKSLYRLQRNFKEGYALTRYGRSAADK